MKHLPFEEWLLESPSRSPLIPEEQAQLDEHLRDCPACRSLSQSWREVDLELQRVEQAAPEPGFTARWQQRLELERKRLHRRQSLAVLSFSIAGAGLLLASLVALSWTYLRTPSIALWTLLYNWFSLVNLLEQLGDLFGVAFRSAGSSVPWLGWVFLFGVLCEIGVIWLVSFRLLTRPRSVSS